METDFDKLPRKITQAQLEGLLAFLCEHPSLAKGNKARHVSEVWDMCAEQLNEICNDAVHQRTGKGWAKYWHDYKYRLKLRANELKSCLDMDDDASAVQRKVAPLTELEQNILELIDENEYNFPKVGESNKDDSILSKDRDINRNNVSEVQTKALMDFMTKHPGLATGKPKIKNKGKLWDECAKLLNELHPTLHKDGKGWAHYWYDYKYRLKIRANELKSCLEMENEGSTAQRRMAPLTELEQDILELIDVEGNDNNVSRGEISIMSKARDELKMQVPEVQLKALIDFITKHPGLATGNPKLKNKGKLWKECAKLLNGLHASFHKDGKGWAHVWYNCKYKVKQLNKESKNDLPVLQQKILALTETRLLAGSLKKEIDEGEQHDRISFVDVNLGDDDSGNSPVPSEHKSFDEPSDSEIPENNFHHGSIQDDTHNNHDDELDIQKKIDKPSENDTPKNSFKRRRIEDAHNGDDDGDLNVKNRIDTSKELIEIEKEKLKLMRKNIESLNRLSDQVSDMTTVLMDIRDRMPKS